MDLQRAIRVYISIHSIRKRRKVLDLTQSQLAKFCGMSQSLITKVEKGRVDPSYSNAIKIFEALDRLEAKQLESRQLIAKDVMTSKIVHVKNSDMVSKARRIMLDKDFSQLPVLDEKSNVVGSITDRDVMLGDRGYNNEEKRVADIMSDAFPSIGPSTKLATLKALLMDESAVLVSDKGKTVGIVTKYDIIKAIQNPASLQR